MSSLTLACVHSRGRRVQRFATQPVPVPQKFTRTRTQPMAKNPTRPYATRGYTRTRLKSNSCLAPRTHMHDPPLCLISMFSVCDLLVMSEAGDSRRQVRQPHRRRLPPFLSHLFTHYCDWFVTLNIGDKFYQTKFLFITFPIFFLANPENVYTIGHVTSPYDVHPITTVAVIWPLTI